MISSLAPLTRLFRAISSVVASVLALGFFGTQTVQAAGVDPAIGSVEYAPALQNFSGNMPFSQSYVFTVKSPANFPVGQSATIGFRIDPTNFPGSLSAATAISFLSISPVASGTFTGPNQTLSFNISGSFPYLAPAPGQSSVSYSYQVYTTGWPASIAGFVTDFGASVGATGTVASSGGQPPTVTISTPQNLQTFTYPAGTTFPVQIPLAFRASAVAQFPITSVDAMLGGNVMTVSSTPLLAANVDGTASMSILAAGTYTVQARGTNSVGTSTATTTFNVVVESIATPTVVINTPADGAIVTYTPAQLPAQLPMQFQATATAQFPVTGVSASFNGQTLTVTTGGLGTANATGNAMLPINAPGTYSVTADATNLGGTATDLNQFTVKVVAPPPTVSISTPAPGTVFNLLAQGPAVSVPLNFQGVSSYGGIRGFTVLVDDVPVNTFPTTVVSPLVTTGTIALSYTTPGTHTVSVVTFDDNGTSQAATTNFSVVSLLPTPTVSVNLTNGTTYTIPSGAASIASIPFTIASTSNNGYKVDNVTASAGSLALSIASHTPALGTSASISSAGTLTNVGPGTYTLTATATSAGVSVSASTSFTVSAAVQQPLPTVVINTPVVGATYSLVSGGPALSIPLTFTGTSNATGGVITALTAKLGTTSLAVTATNLNQKVATGAATMTVTAAGTYTITVTAVDAYGTATATRSFTVTVVQPRTVCGSIFFDVDGDSNYDCEDFGLTGITVKLYNSANVVIGTDVTDCGGGYSFCNVAPGTYRVVATAYAGLKPSSVSERTVTITNCNVTVAKIGFCLDFTAMRTMTAAGKDVAFWKFNLDKANSCGSSGAQISSSTLSSYTCKIGDSALSAYDNITMKQAASLMSTSAPSSNCYSSTSYSYGGCYYGSYSYGSNCTSSSNTCSTWSAYSRQLIAAEYNYQRASYIGANKNLTYLFIWWGEHVLLNPSKYGTVYTTFAQNWFTAYNNSNGGLVLGPTN